MDLFNRALMRWWGLFVCLLAVLVAGCGGGGEVTTSAGRSDIAVTSSQPGVTPFIAFVQLGGSHWEEVEAVGYTIAAKSGTASKPVDVGYTMKALVARGYGASDKGQLTLPVFGLYAGHANALTITLRFKDASVQTLATTVASATYTDQSGIYDRPTVVTRRAVGSELGFDYFALKSIYGTPVVVDTDGEIRWVGVGVSGAVHTALSANAFVVGDPSSRRFSRLEFDGSRSEVYLRTNTYTNFHHNIDLGKFGLLGEVDALRGGVYDSESTAMEFSGNGEVLKEWDFAALIADYMRSQGDDPSTFVRRGVDWFHMNATTYDPRDDSLIVSSRENFVIKVDYQTGRLIWILGDPTKHWYTFPSLRAKALVLQEGGLYPIGQHAVSLTSDGLLMLFNNGAGSNNQPTGALAGQSRSYSAVSAYLIDAGQRSAREVWRIDQNQTIFSPYCSSAYEASGQSLLVNYALANNGASAKVVGFDGKRQLVFDMEYANAGCNTSWNAVPVPFENMRFQ